MISGLLCLLALPAWAQAVDPGPRGGTAGAGGSIVGLSQDALRFFAEATRRFDKIDSVLGKVSGEPGVGLGPDFNMNSCGGCHAHPATGGSSPAINPEVHMATLWGAQNTVPSFIGRQGPVLEVRFIKNPDGTPDGQVHDLYTIAGRIDAPGCTAQQPDFAAAAGNMAFRIPTPLYGLGLVESVPDSGLIAAMAASGEAAFGIAGHFNLGDDGTIMRFGWKAQVKSLLMFAGLAYNQEQGVTNELFPTERDRTPDCQLNQLPEDRTILRPTRRDMSPASDYSSDIVNFAGYIRFLAPATPVASTPDTRRGAAVFANIGCAACHIPTQTTGLTPDPAMSNVTFSPYSDFALHAMGTTLADGISQGQAGPSEFRTAPLWGLGQRLFLLHDGRTTNLVTAINVHASTGSEANTVIRKFQSLPTADQQAVLDFLRSL